MAGLPRPGSMAAVDKQFNLLLLEEFEESAAAELRTRSLLDVWYLAVSTVSTARLGS